MLLELIDYVSYIRVISSSFKLFLNCWLSLDNIKKIISLIGLQIFLLHSDHAFPYPTDERREINNQCCIGTIYFHILPPHARTPAASMLKHILLSTFLTPSISYKLLCLNFRYTNIHFHSHHSFPHAHFFYSFYISKPFSSFRSSPPASLFLYMFCDTLFHFVSILF